MTSWWFFFMFSWIFLCVWVWGVEVRVRGGWGVTSAAQWFVAWSVDWVRVLRVNKWEALELFLVQVGYKLLIWGGQHRGVAREKAIKVLRITPTLPWRGERERQRWRERWEGRWSEFRWGMGGKKGTTTNHKEKKEKIQLKHGINQSNRSQPKLRISIGPDVWAFAVSASTLVTTLIFVLLL